MKKVELEIVALSHSVTQSSNYAVVLGELSSRRRLPIVIGGFEAQAIAVAMEKMAPNRPLTHDLFKNTLDTFSIELEEVIISNLLDGIFYAQLICKHNGDVLEIDSRTSDAIAMAVRSRCPIYTYEFILEAAGVVLEEEDLTLDSVEIEDSPAKGNSYTKMNLNQLNERLESVLADENYEEAARIRDEIARRDQSE